MKIIFTGIVLGLGLTFVGCGKPNAEAELNDVVSPVVEPARMLLSNLSFGAELDLLLKNFGYLPGSNCTQHILNQYRDGSTYETIELFSGPCRNYPIPETPLAQFRMRLDTSGSGFTHWISVLRLRGTNVNDTRPMGRVTIWYPLGRGGILNNLCDVHFSSACDIQLDGNGAIARIAMK